MRLDPLARSRAVAAMLSLSVLAGCAPGQLTTQTSRIGPDDGTDSCRRQLVALDSTGDFFGAQILTGAAIGAATGGLAGALLGGNLKGALIGAVAGGALGAAGGYLSALQQQQSDQAGMFNQMQGDISRENAQIDRTQIAFDQLVDCRFRAAQTIREAYAQHRMDRSSAVAAMAQIKSRAERDLALARQINEQISGRTQQFEVAADTLAPGTAAAVAPPPPTRAIIRQAAALKLRPDPAAPDIGQLQPRQPVTVTSRRDGYALVETAQGNTGYAPQSALQGPAPVTRTIRPAAQAATGAPPPEEVRTLAGSNAARRDTFSESVAVTQQATSSGFELAG